MPLSLMSIGHLNSYINIPIISSELTGNKNTMTYHLHFKTQYEN